MQAVSSADPTSGVDAIESFKKRNIEKNLKSDFSQPEARNTEQQVIGRTGK